MEEGERIVEVVVGVEGREEALAQPCEPLITPASEVCPYIEVLPSMINLYDSYFASHHV